MASLNFRYLITPVGVLRLLSILFMVIALSLGGHAFEHSLYNILYRYNSIIHQGFMDSANPPGLGRERSFIALTTVVLLLSVVLLIGRVFGDSEEDGKSKVVDLVFHGLGTVLLLVAGAFIIDSSIRINKFGCERMDIGFKDKYKCQYRGEKDFAGMFAIATGVLYVLIIILQVVPGCKGRSRGGGGGA